MSNDLLVKNIKYAYDDFLGDAQKVHLDSDLTQLGKKNKINEMFKKVFEKMKEVKGLHDQQIAKNLEQQKQAKIAARGVVYVPDLDEIMLEQREARALISVLTLANSPKEFLTCIDDIVQVGSPAQKRAVLVYFKEILDVAKAQADNGFSGENLAKDSSPQATINSMDEASRKIIGENAVYEQVDIKKVAFLEATKQFYSAAVQSLKTKEQVKGEQRLNSLQKERLEMQVDYDQAVRIFKQLPEYKESTDVWQE